MKASIDAIRRRTRPTGAAATCALIVLAAACDEPHGDPVRVTVPAGASFSAATDSLAGKGIVDQAFLFRLYARIKGADEDVKPGTYAFRQDERWSRVLEDLRAGRILTQRLTIPEGWNLERIAARIAAVTGADADSLLDVLSDTAAATTHTVPGPTLEGYLYPATYTVPVGVSAGAIIERMTEEYRKRWTPERQAAADSLDMSEREVVTLASIVEKEAKRREELTTIAAVYHNRLDRGYLLQADPTVQYALGAHQNRLLYAHIDSVADHPYNTYTQRGLPPGPIASPSAAALDAVLHPADVDFLYFVARPDGSHVFTRSNEAHNRARAEVRRLRREAAGAASADTVGGR